jgi:cell wall assembly regulator SMI1
MLVAAFASSLNAAVARADAVTFRTLVFGNADWVPITGDWNGDGVTEVGAYDSSTGTFYEADAAGDTIATIRFGDPGWVPLTPG